MRIQNQHQNPIDVSVLRSMDQRTVVLSLLMNATGLAVNLTPSQARRISDALLLEANKIRRGKYS